MYTDLRIDDNEKVFWFQCGRDDIVNILSSCSTHVVETGETKKKRLICQFQFDEINRGFKNMLLEINHLYGGSDEIVEEILKALIRSVPSFWHGAIALASLYLRQGKEAEALAIYHKIYELGESLLPDNFKSSEYLLHAKITDNEPFFRAIEEIAIHHRQTMAFAEAIEYYEKLLQYDITDPYYHGVALIDLYLITGQYKNIVKVASRYKGHETDSILFAKILALFTLNKIEEAKKTFLEAYKRRPFIIRSIVNPFKSRPKELDRKTKDWEVLSKRRDEIVGYEYWLVYKPYWQNIPDSIEFLKNQLILIEK